jgi:hypothetical protein
MSPKPLRIPPPTVHVALEFPIGFWGDHRWLDWLRSPNTPVDRDMKKNIVTFLGIILVAVGVMGSFSPHLFGMHLTAFHNFVHIFSGVLAIYFGTKGTPRAARNFCFAFGTVYGLLAVAGFVGGHADSRMLTVIPGHFELGIADHVVHIVVAAAFLYLGVVIKPMATVDRL